MAFPAKEKQHGCTPLRFDRCALLMLGFGLGGCAFQSELPEPGAGSTAAGSTELTSPDHPQPVLTLATISPAERPDAGRVTELQRSSMEESLVEAFLHPRGSATASDEPAAPRDTWDRMRAGFRLGEHVEQGPVQSAVDALSSQTNYLAVMARRGRPYLHFIVEVAEERGVPMEVALVPMVESGFEPYAFSHGRAAGIWQFIPSTGRRLGLKQNSWYDGRRDIYLSTHAAMDYLTRLNEIFDGDWPLTFAAYNAGQGRVLRAQRAAREAGEETDFWSIAPRLPRETRHYVPRILALAELVRNPAEHGQHLPSVPNERYFKRVDVGTPIDLTLAADLAGVSPRELLTLNPGFQRGMTDPEGPYHLLLPAQRAEGFRQQLAEIPDNERVRWHPHQVQGGETLGSIALAYNVSIDEIQAANGLNGHIIRAGATLRIPTASPNLQDDVAAMRILHQVESGENLWLIARQHDVTVDQIARWNGLDRDSTLHPGQELVIRSQVGGGENLAVFQPPRQRVMYRVRSGDSLYTIARKFGVTVEEIRQWNQLSEQSPIHPGETLHIQADVAAVSGN